MNAGVTPKTTPMGLDALVALNDEMAALVRAGVPLDQGLTQLARDLPGRMGAVAKRLGDRLAAGESLDRAVSHEEAALPPVWRAVVMAGVRSGQLAVALEGLSQTGRRIAELEEGLAACRRAMKSLHDSERKYRHLFEHSPAMISLTDLNGFILDINEAGARMLGYDSREELIGIDSARSLYRDPESRLRFQERIARDGSVQEFETQMNRNDGSVIDVHITRLRKKVDQGAGPRLIHTIRGVGFVVREGES